MMMITEEDYGRQFSAKVPMDVKIIYVICV